MKKIELSYLIGEGNYTWLHYPDGQRYLTSKTIKHYESLYLHFIRIHKKVLINPAYIKEISLLPGSQAKAVVLKNGQKLSISRRRWATIRPQLQKAV
ncbi:LytR/AlgR family response regulator transcription factor [Tellurirhabdus bombi]|uniref:LytR/AlgR family response regulator transcription factor n=1 Tax=Tellurirhabdus bombi TaxID=2907205 RepID=UPI001F2DB771|nr:LytTR family DNA-binding domain-containing protein [Tellurirhabdus bombi]